MLKKNALFLLTTFTVISLFAADKEDRSAQLSINSMELTIKDDSLALSKEQAEQLSNQLIHEPLKLLNEHKQHLQVLDSICGHCSGDKKCNATQLQNFLKEHRLQNPIFMISECNSSMCGLSRHENSSRSFYEATVVSYLQKYKNQQRINFVAFASGGLFQELIILAQVISLYNISNINIHLIDPSYGTFIQALSSIDGQSNAINIARYNNFNFHDYSLQKESEAYKQQECEMYLIARQEKFRQFVSIVKQWSDNNVKIFVHQNAGAYVEFCAQHPQMRADVIAAMDLEPEFRYTTAVKDYYGLIYHTLKKGGVAILADNEYFGPEKLNMIDYVAHTVPNKVCLIQHLFYETMWKHVVNLSKEQIFSPLKNYNKFNTAFVGVHHKKEECLDESLQNMARVFAQPSNYSELDIELKKLDNNEFITHSHEFKNLSATKTLSIGAMAIAVIYTAGRMNLFSRN